MGRKDNKVRKGWHMSVAVLNVQCVDGGKVFKKWSWTTAQWVTLFSAKPDVLTLIPGIHILIGRREASPANCSLVSTCMLGHM